MFKAAENHFAIRVGLFRWLLFNVLIVNQCNHFKNVSLLVSDESASLEKTYDLLCSVVYLTDAYRSSGVKWSDIDLMLQKAKRQL